MLEMEIIIKTLTRLNRKYIFTKESDEKCKSRQWKPHFRRSSRVIDLQYMNVAL